MIIRLPRRRRQTEAERIVRQQRWRYRAETARTLALPVLVAIIVPVTIGMLWQVKTIGRDLQAQGRSIKATGEERVNTAKDIRRAVAYVDKIQSPEAAAAQKALLDGVVGQISCNGREALQEALDALGSQVSIVCPSTPPPPLSPAPSGTTSTIPGDG